MTLTYRGSSYDVNNKLPSVQPIVELQYRGKTYQARTSAASAQVHANMTFVAFFTPREQIDDISLLQRICVRSLPRSREN